MKWLLQALWDFTMSIVVWSYATAVYQVYTCLEVHIGKSRSLQKALEAASLKDSFPVQTASSAVAPPSKANSFFDPDVQHAAFHLSNNAVFLL